MPKQWLFGYLAGSGYSDNRVQGALGPLARPGGERISVNSPAGLRVSYLGGPLAALSRSSTIPVQS